MSLEGKLVVLTRTENGNRVWAAYLAHHGVETYSLPAIEAGPAPIPPQTQAILRQLAGYDWLVFTSAFGVRHAQAEFARLTIDLTSTRLPRIAVVGESSEIATRYTGLPVAFRPSHASTVALAGELPDVAGRRILMLRTNIASDTLARTLRRRGAEVTELPIYQTRLREDADPAFSQLLQAGGAHYLVFASPSAVHGFIRRITHDDLRRAKSLPAVAIGPSVAAALEQMGFSSIHQAAQPNVAGVYRALIG